MESLSSQPTRATWTTPLLLALLLLGVSVLFTIGLRYVRRDRDARD